ncbi:hypothetical protein [Consotaella salsifontis]|uniref:Uncharacterized protein n=1 Tax=Consotaella salsifontis TaxID=1365950 RepID=A0A1T4QL65_9HYPH|nr:hypothetical protein [Consotaella salsifontis]SKA04008.1 hypothetical protein SAMN05428963_10589 [Consotaella salsifontis]
MPDVDSRLIRSNQDQDTPQHIVEDETTAQVERADSDPQSGRDRQAAAHAEAEGSGERRHTPGTTEARAIGATAYNAAQRAIEGAVSLVRPGRSILWH